MLKATCKNLQVGDKVRIKTVGEIVELDGIQVVKRMNGTLVVDYNGSLYTCFLNTDLHLQGHVGTVNDCPECASTNYVEIKVEGIAERTYVFPYFCLEQIPFTLRTPQLSKTVTQVNGDEDVLIDGIKTIQQLLATCSDSVEHYNSVVTTQLVAGLKEMTDLDHKALERYGKALTEYMNFVYTLGWQDGKQEVRKQMVDNLTNVLLGLGTNE